jgi:hypothetical protein
MRIGLERPLVSGNRFIHVTMHKCAFAFAHCSLGSLNPGKWDLADVGVFQCFQRYTRKIAVVAERTRLLQGRQGALAHLLSFACVLLIDRIGVQGKPEPGKHRRIVRISEGDLFQQGQRRHQILRFVNLDCVLPLGRVLSLSVHPNWNCHYERDEKQDSH